MRKITKEAVKAFFSGERYRKSNTSISHHIEDEEKFLFPEKKSFFFLYNHCIAIMYNNKIEFCDCGYQTNTTKERLNGILDYLNLGKIYQKKGVWYWQNDLIWSNHINEVNI